MALGPTFKMTFVVSASDRPSGQNCLSSIEPSTSSNPAGLLEVDGSIELKQFWPEGRSDADTTKVILNVGPNAIKFRKDSSSPFQPTHVFNNAKEIGRASCRERV